MQASLRWLALLAGGIGGLLPGYSFFVDGAPPFFEATGVLTSGAALVLLVRGFYRQATPDDALKRGARYIVAAFVLLTLYGAGLRFLTVAPPAPHEAPRQQIGFFLSEWSMTPEALAALDDPELGLRTPQELMLAFGAYGDGDAGPTRIWKTWSVLVAGLLLIVLFVAGFLLWTTGFALVASFAAHRGLPRAQEHIG